MASRFRSQKSTYPDDNIQVPSQDTCSKIMPVVRGVGSWWILGHGNAKVKPHTWNVQTPIHPL